MNDENEIERDEIEQISEDTPNADKVERVNPWRKPISYITWGFLLTSFTLNMLLLQYILPTIGVVLLFLGFRSLRKGNGWFFTAWIMVTMKLILQAVKLIESSTPIIIFDNNNLVIIIIAIIFQLVLLYVFRKALRMVFRQADIMPARDPILSAIIWTVLLAIFALSPFASFWPILIPLICIYFVIIRSMFRVGEDLRKAADAFVEAPIKISNKVVTTGCFICFLVLVAICCISASHIKLEESKQAAITDSVTRDDLMDMGFPENILMDVSDKDVSMLSGAIHIESSSDTLSFDPVKVTTKNGTNGYSITNKPGDSNLQATTVYIEFPDNLLYVLVYFDWMESKAYWQDGFTIWGEEGFELLKGELLYQKNGEEYTAPIPRLKCEVLTSYNMFGTNESRQISGAVSYPFFTEKQRGYVFYRLHLPTEQWIGCNGMNYVHYTHPFQFPYGETEKRILNGNYNFNNNKGIHYSTFELQAYRDANQ